MLTLNKIISTVRTLIKQHTDDSIYTDEFLYSLLLDGRAYLLEQNYKKYKQTSDWNKKTYCIELEKDKAHDCSCVAVGCEILKTVFKIPKPIQVRGFDKIEVFTLDYDTIDFVKVDYIRDVVLDDIYSSKFFYSIINDKILLFNVPGNKLKAVLVRSIPEDPTEWQNITLCDSDGNPTEDTCYNIQEDEFPIDKSLVALLYDLILNQLKLPLQLVEDLTNDNNAEIKV